MVVDIVEGELKWLRQFGKPLDKAGAMPGPACHRKAPYEINNDVKVQGPYDKVQLPQKGQIFAGQDTTQVGVNKPHDQLVGTAKYACKGPNQVHHNPPIVYQMPRVVMLRVKGMVDMRLELGRASNRMLYAQSHTKVLIRSKPLRE